VLKSFTNGSTAPALAILTWFSLLQARFHNAPAACIFPSASPILKSCTSGSNAPARAIIIWFSLLLARFDNSHAASFLRSVSFVRSTSTKPWKLLAFFRSATVGAILASNCKGVSLVGSVLLGASKDLVQALVGNILKTKFLWTCRNPHASMMPSVKYFM